MKDDKKYQVFVSSTYQDLVEERKEVMQALLELGCIPSGMELFPAANEDQWTLIKEVIDDCDYYIVIIAGRYGSLGPSGISYTQMEYDYAVSRGKPVLGFLHKDPGLISSAKTEATDDGKRRLEAFRDIAKQRVCKFWSTPQELGLVVNQGLLQLQRKHPGIGWVRADKLAGDEAAQEILRLRHRVDELEAEVAVSRTTAPGGTELLAQGDDVFPVTASFSSWSDQESNVCEWSDEAFEVTWNVLFYLLSPLMINEASKAGLRTKYDHFVTKLVSNAFEARDPRFEGYDPPSYVRVDMDVFETVLIQFNALGLITQSARPRSVKDGADYWSLTPYGNSVMNRLRAVKRSSPGYVENP